MKLTPAPGSTRELLQVAWPLVVSSGSTSLMYVVDRMFLTWYSTDALAAGFSAGMMHWTLMSLVLGTAAYVNTFVAQYDGAGQSDRVAAVIWQGIYFSLVASLLVLALVPFAASAFAWFGHDAEVRRLETEYFNVLCFGSAPLLLATTLGCYFSGRGQTRTIMWVNLTTTLVKILLDYLMIFGNAGFPALGIRGAALSTVIAYSLDTLLYLFALCGGGQQVRRALWAARRFDPALFLRLLRFGLPNGFQWFVDVVSFTLFVQLVGMMGKTQLTATSLAFNLNSFVFIPLLGVGTAVMTITGQRVGEGRPELAVRTTWTAFALSTAYVGLFGLVYVLAPYWIMLPFAWGSNHDDFQLIEQHVVGLLRFVAAYSLFDAMTVIFSSATRGAGDTRFALLFSVTSGLLLLVLPTFALYRAGNTDLHAAWGVVTLFASVLGLGFLWRFRQGAWKSMHVIERVPGELEPASATVG